MLFYSLVGFLPKGGAPVMRDEVGNAPFQLACFARWANFEAGVGKTLKSRTMKIEVRCKDCGTIFVKYAYGGTVRCAACRKARGKADRIDPSSSGLKF